MSLTELICLACHCSFPVPLVTAGLVLSCVLIGRRVDHSPREVPISTIDWLRRWSENGLRSLSTFVYVTLILISKGGFHPVSRSLCRGNMTFRRKLVNCSLQHWLWYLLSQPTLVLACRTSLYVKVFCAKYMFGRFVWDAAWSVFIKSFRTEEEGGHLAEFQPNNNNGLKSLVPCYFSNRQWRV